MARNAFQEVDFWSRQFVEHLQFLAMLFTDPGAKAEAVRLIPVYQAARTKALSVHPAAAAEVIRPAHDLVRSYQSAMFDRLNSGEFLGWAFPLFVSHITREMDLFSHLVYGTPSPDVGVAGEVKRLGEEHARFAAHLLDPSESGLVRQAGAAADALGALVHNNSTAANAAAAQGERAIITFLTKNKIGTPGGALSIIPKQLTDHVIREQNYFIEKLTEPR